MERVFMMKFVLRYVVKDGKRVMETKCSTMACGRRRHMFQGNILEEQVVGTRRKV